MDIYKKLAFHLEESLIHIDRLIDVLNILQKLYPLNNAGLEKLTIEDIV